MDDSLVEPLSSAQKAPHRRHCCVPYCVSNGRKKTDAHLSFHQFPKDKKRRKEWICKVRRDEGPHFKITSNTYVCMKHFKPDDFKSSWTQLRRDLKPSAVPSIFNFPDKKPPKRRPSLKKKCSPRKRLRFDSQIENMDQAPTGEDRSPDTAPAEPSSLTREPVPTPCVHPDHDYDVPPHTTQDALEAAKKRIQELEHVLEVEKKKQFCLQRFAGNNNKKIRKYCVSNLQ